MRKFKWSAWSPRKELSPEFFIEDDRLKIITGDNPHVYGKFLSGEIAVSDSDMIIFEALFSCENRENAKNPNNGIFAMISFYDDQKKLLERDYAAVIGAKLFRKLDAPENTAYVIIETGVRWRPGVVVEWSDISLTTYSKAAELSRTAKIATTYKKACGSLAENLDDIINIIDKAGASNPDVILLSELVYETCWDGPALSLEEKAQAIPGPLTDTIGEYAKKYNAYIIFTMNEKADGVIYNTAVITDRKGKICGKYRKTHLPLFEAEQGTSPGDTHYVFDLDFGKAGILICYDQYFPENARTLALMGAEIIFIPTQGEDEVVHRAIARMNGVHVIVSGYTDPAHSRIINPLGETVNHVKNKDTAYTVEEIDMNKRFFSYWMSVGAGNGEPRVLFEKERITEVYKI
jgi:predicted amidohydrolase